LNILSTIAAQLDKILVFHYLGASQLALYALSQIPVSQTRALLKPIVQMVFPKYSERPIGDIRISIYRKMILLTIPIIVIVTVYIILAPFIFKIFFPKYIDAVLYSQIGILSLLFFQKKLIAYTALAHASKKIIYGMSIYASLSKIILLLVLLPLYGIWGAIFTDLIVHAVGLISSLWILKRF
jgi:O-antigen/teichoic acid export membrane protein